MESISKNKYEEGTPRPDPEAARNIGDGQSIPERNGVLSIEGTSDAPKFNLFRTKTN